MTAAEDEDRRKIEERLLTEAPDSRMRWKKEEYRR
jgi:hypothetical protein